MVDNLGQTIKEARKRKGLTQRELASFLGVTQQNIQRYENNLIGNIPLSSKYKIAIFLDLDIKDLLTENEQKYVATLQYYKDENNEIDKLALKLIKNVEQSAFEDYIPVIETDRYLCLDKDWFKNTIDSIKDYIVYSFGKEIPTTVDTKNTKVKPLNLEEKMRNKNKE